MKSTTNLLLIGISAALFSSIGDAQIVPGDIIYSNSFTGGTNTINGTAPTLANTVLGGTNTALWICTATNSALTNNDTIYANGTLGTNAGSAVLPFKPQAGAVYYLTASAYLPAANNWIGLGFCQTAIQGSSGGSERFTDANVKGNPWMDIREGNSINFFGGPETQLPSTGADVEPAVATYTFTIILNTLGSKWITAAYINGTLEGTTVVGSTQLGTNIVYGSNPTIGYAGLTQQAITAGDAVQWNYIALSTALLPMITQPPTSQALPVGSPYTNTVGAIADTNGGSLYYQWFTNGVLMTGATNSTLILNPTIASEAGANYYVVVTNTYGAVTSGAVSLTLFVTNPPTFTVIIPTTYSNTMTLYGGTNVGGTNYAGSTPTFVAMAVGAEPILYQWLTNGVAVSAATNASFTLTNCQLNSPTNFSCIATNNYGKATNAWSVAYLPAPVAPYPQAVLTAQPVAYWRLNEPDDNVGDGNPGAICKDYQSGNNGIYTNVNLGQNPGYNSITDPTETSALFGESGLSLYFSYAGQIEGVDFAPASGSNAEFTVEAWVNGYPGAQMSGSTVITEGTYGANDEFALNMDASSPHHYQFYVRGANGTVYTADSAFAPDDNWHHLAGVCDEANGQVSLYIDGQLAASSSIPANSGVYEADMPLSIGAGIQGAATNYTLQFRGYIDDVAAYNYALSSNEVLAQYVAAGEPPAVVQTPPANVTIGAGATLVLPAAFIGTPPLGYYWTDVNANTNVMAGATTNILLNATLTAADVASNWNGDSLQLTVTNAYGSINYNVYLSVIGGPPQILTDVQTSFFALIGGAASNSITVIGAFPMYYQWQFNGTNLPESGELSGTQSNIFLNITNAQGSNAGSYQVIISNNYGSVTSSVATFAVVGLQPISFDGTGPGWTTNQLGTASSPFITDGVLTLTDGGGSEARSFFFNYPQYIGAFEASFTYQATGGAVADGATFCLQNDPRGASALGSTGGALGVNTNSGGTVHNITPSAELELNIYAPAGLGYSFNTNGTIGPNTLPGNVNIKSGDPIDVTLYYAQGQMALALTDAVAATSFSTNLAVGDLPQFLGSNTAYIGFTGADGGSTSIQTISNFSFVSIPMAAIQLSHTNAVISWPGVIVGYELQQNADLSTTNWVKVTNQDTPTNGFNQVTVPLGGSSQFYRLILQP